MYVRICLLTIESIQHLLYSFQPHTTEMAKEEKHWQCMVTVFWGSHTMGRPSCTVHKRRTSQQHVCYTLCIMQSPCLPLHDWHRKTAKWDKQSQTVLGSPDSSSLTRTLLLLGNTSQHVCNTSNCANHMFLPAVIRMTAPLSCLEPQDF